MLKELLFLTVLSAFAFEPAWSECIYCIDNSSKCVGVQEPVFLYIFKRFVIWNDYESAQFRFELTSSVEGEDWHYVNKFYVYEEPFEAVTAWDWHKLKSVAICGGFEMKISVCHKINNKGGYDYLSQKGCNKWEKEKFFFYVSKDEGVLGETERFDAGISSLYGYIFSGIVMQRHGYCDSMAHFTMLFTFYTLPGDKCRPMMESVDNGKIECRKTVAEPNEVTCEILCDESYSYVATPEKEVRCGKDTSYLWSHQLNNPLARIPKCTKNTFADTAQESSFKVNLPADYDMDSYAENKNMIVFQIQKAIFNYLCLDHIASADHPVCPQMLYEISIHKEQNQKFLQIQIVIIFHDTSVSFPSDCNSECQLNHSVSAFWEISWFIKLLRHFVQDGKWIFDGDENIPELYAKPLTFNSSFHKKVCAEYAGYVHTDHWILCAPCPPGYYQTDRFARSCIPCEVNSYQDEEGKSSCKACPDGATTVGEASSDIAHCRAPASSEESEESQ